MSSRIIEAYVGEYASGKSELAINRALELRQTGKTVTLVDLDFVEPFYTLRPLKIFLEEQGLGVVGWGRDESFGLGEAGSVMKPAARWVLRREGDIIMDVGYGVRGAHTLNLIEGAYESKELQVYGVLNASRPMTASADDIIEYVRTLGHIDGLINNTHLGGETTVAIIVEGLHEVQKASEILQIPIIATAVNRELADQIGGTELETQNIRYIQRYMPAAMW